MASDMTQYPVSPIEDPLRSAAPEQISENTGDSSAIDAGVKRQLKAIGASGTELFAGYFSEEYLQTLRGRKGAKTWDEIRRSEAQVAMLLNAIMNSIKAGTWEVEAAEVPNGEIHKELAEFCLMSMIDWETHLHEALTAIIFGFSVFETVNNVVLAHPKFGNFNGLKALAFRSQKTIERWLVDPGTGDLQAIEQWVQGDLAINRASINTMDAQFCLVFTVQKEGDNYEGISLLRPMYGPWFRKNLYLRIMGIGIEKNAIGTPIGKVPAGKVDVDQLEKFKATLENFTAHESAYLTIPAGWDITILQNSFDPSKLKDAIVMENTEMINSVVANFLALGTSGGSGSFALGENLSDFFLKGIQVYANIISGVHNRKTIPDLIKLNFGPQASYPTLKSSGITDKAGKELAEIIGLLTKSQGIKADAKLEDFLRKSYQLPKADLASSRELVNVTERITGPNVTDDIQDPPDERVPLGTVATAPAKAAQFSETRIQLAESYKANWNANKADLKEIMQTGLASVYDDLKNQIRKQFKSATPAQKKAIGLNLKPKTQDYVKALRERLAELATESYNEAKKMTPKARKLKLGEPLKLGPPNGGYFDALPPKIKAIVKTQAQLIADTQSSDLDKIVSFQYTTSEASTDNVDQILTDVDAAAIPTIEDGATGKGMSIDAAAGNAVSSVGNQAQMEWFFEPEVLDTIESFTFTNEDPVSDICQELDGTTWAVDDPDLDRYSPPLHHNCKSRLEPNEKGADGNPDIDRGGTPLTQKALDSMTLCECDYHLKFEMVSPKAKR